MMRLRLTVFLIAVIYASCPQTRQFEPYLADADDLILTAEQLRLENFSVSDAVKLFGAIDDKNNDPSH